MRFIICDDCGGYYKLRDEESLEDFEECHCGGNLRYAQSFKEIVKNRDVPKLICINCGAENKETNNNCSECGKKLRKINRRVSDYRVKKERNYSEQKPHFNLTNFLDKISFLGLFAGLVFLVIATVIAAMGMFGSYASSNGVDILRSMGGYIIIMIFAIIASGFIASFISGVTDYTDGLLNGGLVGFAVSLLMAFFVTLMGMVVSVSTGIFAGLITLIAYLIIYGSLTAVGGLAAVWIRNYMDDY